MTHGMTVAQSRIDAASVAAAIARAAASAAPTSYLILEHGDVASATAAVDDAMRAAGMRPVLVRTVASPGLLVDEPATPDPETTAVIVADARRGRRHQIEALLRAISAQATPGRIVAITTHADAGTLARIVRDETGCEPETIHPN